MIIYYIEENEVECLNFEASTISVPQFKGIFSKFQKSFDKMHKIKKSRFVRLDKHKKKGKTYYEFRVKNKPEKKPTLGTVKATDCGKAEKFSKSFFPR
jgi:hypothetical protein